MVLNESATSREGGDISKAKISSKPLALNDPINAFSFKLYHVIKRYYGNDNMFYSPIGIIYTFSMLMLGANDQSELEVFYGLHLNESFASPQDAHIAFRSLLKVIERKANYSIDLANIILIQKNERFLKEFTKRLGSFYKVTIGEVDFLKNGMRVMKEINEWVAQNTHNKIKQLLKEPLDPLTRLVILNAVYFKGHWKYGFDSLSSTTGKFYNQGKTPKDATFMHNIEKFGYFEDPVKKYQLLELKYSGEASFLIVLPKEKDGLNEIVRTVEIKEILRPLEEKEVQISMPKFKLESEYDLKKVLPELGIKAIFGPGADLSGISGDKTLFVSSGIHKSMIEVNEEGTEAASATGVVVATRNYKPIPVVNVDHPFIFIIRDTKYDLIYFMGRLNVL
ncbi:leukocyte elastase inhibitor-like protein [Dinothrombium tinctorium]|uniref:Leukocyte elastase inhibitor-like protein n=1 Tax=Dinothrombium tinctorium TaxID=1965070 RepID=A0A3S3SKP2_9ACAR|nr:leukocyte elastase inhibitor-like protein [Dinothrombium tinctorium]